MHNQLAIVQIERSLFHSTIGLFVKSLLWGRNILKLELIDLRKQQLRDILLYSLT